MAIPYVKQAWADADATKPLSAARMLVIEQGIFEAHLMPAVRVFHNANQSITNAVTTALAFNSERFDTFAGAADTQHDTVTNNNRLTCRYAGKYLIGGNCSFASNATGVRTLSIQSQAGTTVGDVQIDACSGGVTDLSVSTMWDMAVNDWVQMLVFQNSGGALNVLVSAAVSPEFWMVRVA
jgi:hypothetical protein